jgi:hypothetical protein
MPSSIFSLGKRKMFRIGLLIVALTTLLSSVAFSAQINLDEGLTVDPADTLELSFETISGYDIDKKVLIRKVGEKPQYFISVSSLPQGLSNGGQYFTQLLRDLNADSVEGSVQMIEQGQYKTDTGVSGSYIEYAFKPNGGDRSHQQIAHFLTRSGRSFLAIATLINSRADSQMHVDSIAIFRTASISAGVVSQNE